MNTKAKFDTGFFQQLESLSESALMTSMLALAEQDDAASLYQAALVLTERPTARFRNGHSLAIVSEDDGVRDCGYSAIFARALQSTSRVYAQSLDVRMNYLADGYLDAINRPAPALLTPDQTKLFNQVLYLYQREPLGDNNLLDQLLIECVQGCSDPLIFTRLLEAGANPNCTGLNRSLKHPLHPLQEEDIHVIAQECGNVKALEILIEASGIKKVQFCTDLSRKVDPYMSGYSGADKTIAALMVLRQGNFEGLHCMRLIENNASFAQPWDILNFRCQILTCYLSESIRVGVKWDPAQVKFLMGEIPSVQGMPDQLKTIATTYWNKINYQSSCLLLTTALQAHCTPVLEMLMPSLQQLSKTGIFPLPLYLRRPGGNVENGGFHGLSAAGLLFFTPPGGAILDRDNFEATFRLLESHDFLGSERRSGTWKWPVYHSVAKHQSVDRVWALMYLLEAGLPHDVTDRNGDLATVHLSNDEGQQWDSIIRSFHAKNAALHALTEIGADEPLPNAAPVRISS